MVDENGLRRDMDILTAHIKVAEDWVAQNYDTAEQFSEVNDLMIEAGRMFDEWGLGQNQTMNMDDMINALSFVQTHRDTYF